MKIRTLLFCILCLLFTTNVYTQTAPEIEWQNTYGGLYWDSPNIIMVTTNGGIILGGSSESDISGNKTETLYGASDYWLIKLDSIGNILWQKTYGGDQADQLLCIDKTLDGGFILGGMSQSDSSGNKTENTIGPGVIPDYWVIKIDDEGNIVWQNTIGGKYDDVMKSIKQTPDGGYILAGSSSSNKTGDKTENNKGLYDYWVVKLNDFGEIEWQNTIGGNDYDYLESIDLTTDGGYILGGYSYSSTSPDKSEASEASDYWIIKLDNTGNILWDKTIEASYLDFLYDLKSTSDGGFIVGGASSSSAGLEKEEDNFGIYDYWVIKFDAEGIVMWQNTIGGSLADNLNSIIETTDGYILAGISESPVSGEKTIGGLGGYDYWIVKVNDTGTIMWQTVLGGTDYDGAQCIEIAPDGGVIVVGYSNSDISGNKTSPLYGAQDYWVVKLYPENQPCDTPPLELYVDFLTSSTAKLHWTTDPDATKYKVQYRKTSVPAWTTTYAFSNFKNLFSLEPNTTYKFRVKSICPGGIQSGWSIKATFTTLPLREGVNGEFSKLNVYPNPANSTLFIETHGFTNNVTIIITNTVGEKVNSLQTAASDVIELDIQNLAAGIYTITVSDGQRTVTEKFVKE